MLLVLLSVFLLRQELSIAEEQSLVVSFCKNAAIGEWSNNLRDLFSITLVGITEIYCTGVSKNDIVIATTIGSQYEQLVKPDEQDLDVYLHSILRKMSYTKIKLVNEESELQLLLKDNEDNIVSFIQGKSMYSAEHRVFQQLAISLGIPENLQIIVTHNAAILSNYVQLNVSKNMEVWYVENGRWIVLEAPDIEEGVTTPEELHYKLITYIRHLKYPTIFHYSGDDFVDTYDGSRLDFILIFHATDQLAEVTKEIVEPLLKEFKLYYAFILIDSEKYPEMIERFKIEKKSLPQIMSLKNEQKNGILIDPDEVPYTADSLVKVLTLIRKEPPKMLMVDPEYMNSTNRTLYDSIPSDDNTEEYHHTEL